MITLEQTKNGKAVKITDSALDIILNALEHEMERYCQAQSLISDATAMETVGDTLRKVRHTHTTLCSLIYDPESE